MLLFHITYPGIGSTSSPSLCTTHIEPTNIYMQVIGMRKAKVPVQVDMLNINTKHNSPPSTSS
jgi:hypothetical protein